MTAPTCKVCSQTYSRRPSQTDAGFCSRACYTTVRQRPARSCEACGNPIAGIGKRFCSWECRGRGNAKERTIRACRNCDKPMSLQPSRLAKVFFCSYRCKGAWSVQHWNRSISAVEQRFTSLLRQDGLAFETQQRICGYVVDAYFPASNLVVEFDGDYWHSLPRVAARDRRKNAEWAAAGLRVHRVREGDFKRNPAAVVSAVRNALTQEMVA